MRKGSHQPNINPSHDFGQQQFRGVQLSPALGGNRVLNQLQTRDNDL